MRMISVLSLILIVSVVGGCGASATERYPSGPYPVGFEERGMASWYGPGFQGNRTASGERFDRYQLTAAHRTLPMGSMVRVRFISNGRRVTVRINDRGPFARDRIIDLSEAAAEAIGMIGPGTGEVVLTVIGYQGLERVGFLRVQVASFAEPALAQALVDRLQDRYADLRIIAVDLPSGTRYRVQVGRFSSEQEAAGLVHDLRTRMHFESFIVRDTL